MAASINTSIFAENFNMPPGWDAGYSTPWRVSGAKIYINGIGQNWSAQHRHTAHSCPGSYPVADAVKASVVGAQEGRIRISGIPLKC